MLALAENGNRLYRLAEEGAVRNLANRRTQENERLIAFDPLRVGDGGWVSAFIVRTDEKR